MRSSRLAALRANCDPEKIRDLHAHMTDSEQRMWYYLRARRFDKRKFRRQVPMGPYVVDFVCERERLIVEVDGGQHDEQRRYDAKRTQWLESRGYKVVRFWNNEVIGSIDAVMESLSLALAK